MPDDDMRALVELCLKWCRILWLPGSVFDAPWDDREFAGGMSLKKMAYHIAWLAAEEAVTSPKSGGKGPYSFSRRPRPAWVIRRGEVLRHRHTLSPGAQALANMVPHLRPLPPPADLNLYRHYAFYAVLCELGLIPYRVLSGVGMLLYDLGNADLVEAFDGQLTPEEGQANKWRELRAGEVRKLYRDRLPPGWRWAMREARGAEREHMRFVVDELSGDLLLSPDSHTPHAGDFRTAYDRVVTSEAPPRGEGPCHRRGEAVEQLAEHLIVCTLCGGLDRLLGNGSIGGGARAAATPKLALHVPDYFPPHETDGART